MISPNLSCI